MITAEVTLIADELSSAVEHYRAQAPGSATYALKLTARHSETAPSSHCPGRCHRRARDAAGFINA